MSNNIFKLVGNTSDMPMVWTRTMHHICSASLDSQCKHTKSNKDTSSKSKQHLISTMDSLALTKTNAATPIAIHDYPPSCKQLPKEVSSPDIHRSSRRCRLLEDSKDSTSSYGDGPPHGFLMSHIDHALSLYQHL